MLSQKSEETRTASWKTIGVIASALLGFGALFARSNAWTTAQASQDHQLEDDRIAWGYYAMTEDGGDKLAEDFGNDRIAGGYAMAEDGGDKLAEDFGNDRSLDKDFGHDRELTEDLVVTNTNTMATLRCLADNNQAMGFSGVIYAQQTAGYSIASNDWGYVATLAGYILGVRPAGDATAKFAKELFTAMVGKYKTTYDYDFDELLAAGATATDDEVAFARRKAAVGNRYLSVAWVAVLPAFVEDYEITGAVRERFDKVCGLDASRCDLVLDALTAEHQYMTGLRAAFGVPASAKSAESVSADDDNALRVLADFRAGRSAGAVPVLLDFVYTDEFTTVSESDLALVAKLTGYVASADERSGYEVRLVRELMYEAAGISKSTTSKNFAAGIKYTKDEALAVANTLRTNGGNLAQKAAFAGIGCAGGGEVSAFEAFRFMPVCKTIFGGDSSNTCEKIVLLFAKENFVRSAYLDLFQARN